jgi:hypothetical protein
VQRILDDKRNARRKLSDLTGKELRRQHAIRLVEATALNNITQAEYCRRSGLKPYEATRWIASFCEQEPGLREALSAIGACLETVFSEKVQQRRVLLQKVKEPNVTLVPGFDPDTLQTQATGYRMAFQVACAAVAPVGCRWRWCLMKISTHRSSIGPRPGREILISIGE